MRSYSSIFNIGHRAVTELLKGPVHIEEKIDGSQISFGVYDGELRMRSKGSDINVVAPEGMFSKAVAAVQARQNLLTPGYTYRGEYLQKPKHNTLAYSRTPKDFIMLWDIDTGEECYMQPKEKAAEAARIDFECVPHFDTGVVKELVALRKYLDRESVLGGQKIEGIVIKPANYALFDQAKKLLIAKLVSEEFKEVHNSTWTKEHKTPPGGDFILMLAGKYTTAARWQKAYMRLEETGALEGSMRDVPKLLAEVPPDIEKECKEEIMDALWEWAWPQLRRQVIKGAPEWLKDKLMRAQADELTASAQANGEYQP